MHTPAVEHDAKACLPTPPSHAHDEFQMCQVTFHYSEDASLLIRMHEESGRFLSSFDEKEQKSSERKAQEFLRKLKSVDRAPQVSDIIWENVPSTGTFQHDWLRPALLTVAYFALACVVFYVVLLLTTTKLDIGRSSAERVRSFFENSEDRCVALG